MQKLVVACLIACLIATFACGQELLCYSYENGGEYPYQQYFSPAANTTIYVYDDTDDEAEFYTIGSYDANQKTMVFTRMNYWRDLLWYADIYVIPASKTDGKGYKKFEYGPGMTMAVISDKVDFIANPKQVNYIQCDENPSPNRLMMKRPTKKNAKFLEVMQKKINSKDASLMNMRNPFAVKANDTDKCIDIYPSDPSIPKTRIQYKVYQQDMKNKMAIYTGIAKTEGVEEEMIVYGIENAVNFATNVTVFHAFQPLPEQPSNKKVNNLKKFVDYQANVVQYFNSGNRIKSVLSYSVGVLLTPDKMNTDTKPKIVPCRN